MSKVAVLFPGQGAQSVGMAKDLCQTLPAARQKFTEASAILGYDLLDVCVNGPADRLNSTVVSQPAIFVASLAALESVADPGRGTDCVATAGLSLGEYTALSLPGPFLSPTAFDWFSGAVKRCRPPPMPRPAAW